MKALMLTHPEATKGKLLFLAKQVPEARIGFKIAALLLVLEGQPPGRVNAMLGLSRMTLERWINGMNREGIQSLIPVPKSGRPTQLTASVRQKLERDLEKAPREFGIQRSSWDGPTLVIHLRKCFGVNIKIRQAQYWLHRLDYSLKRAAYVYLQARAKDAKDFRQGLKKTVPPSG
jgi:transposase